MDEKVLTQLAHVLSALTVMSCMYLKVPQIMYVRESKSAEGIYIRAMLLEMVGFSIVTLYNYTNKYYLMTYLEYPVILLQIYVLAYYVLRYTGKLNQPVVVMAVICYVIIMVLFSYGWLPNQILSYIIPFCTPIGGFAKLTYIYGMMQAGKASTVSLTTWMISTATNLSRVFTTHMDSSDKKLMINFLVSAVLSGGVLITAAYFKMFPRPPEIPETPPDSPPESPPPSPPPSPRPSPPRRRRYVRRNNGQNF